MERKEVKEWVEKRLNDGIEEERIRKVLSKKGFSPSLVDEVKEQAADKTHRDTKNNRNQDTDNRSNNARRNTARNGSEFSKRNKLRSDKKQQLESKSNKKSTFGRGKNVIGGAVRKTGKGIRQNWKIILAIILIPSLIAAVWMFAPIGPITDSLQDIRDSNSNSDQTNTDVISHEEAENITEIVLEDGSATPSRPTITRRNTVEFINEEDHDLEIAFDRVIENVTVPAGDSKLVDVGLIVYYTAYPIGEEGQKIDGSVNVQ